MALSICTVVLFLSVVVSVHGQTPPPFGYPSICAPPNQTILDPTLPAGTKMPQLPYIPDTFQLRVEANIIDKQTTWSAEEYSDDTNNRAALRILRNNSMNYMIFDYTNNQIIYDVNGNCSVTTLNRDPYGNEIIFGMKSSGGGGGIPHIYTTSSALHFAKSNGLMYKGPKIVRGINCDWWQSCMYWPNLAANFTLDYYFSAYNWTAPDLSNQVPVLAEIQGVTLGATPFHHTYEYFDYRNHIWGSDSVFDTPQGKVCPGRKQTRKVPVLSTGQYSFREEIVDTMNLGVSQADIYYDYTNNVVRIDYRPLSSRYPYYATNPVSEIHDYSTGVAYGIDNVRGNCTIFPLTNTSIYTTVESSNRAQFSLRMKSPNELFYLDNTTYTYEGTRTVRGILCDVFISNRTDFKLPGYPEFSSTFEIYFLNKVWVDYSSGSTDVPIQLRISTPDWVGYTALYNIYDFTPGAPSADKFSIASCYAETSKTAFRIAFPGNWDISLMQYHNLLISKITDEIVKVGHVSPIRVQDRQLVIDSDVFYFIATLLDMPPPLGTTQSQVLNMSSPDVMRALKNIVITGNFRLNVNVSGQVTTVTADSIDDNIIRNPQRKLSTKALMDRFSVQTNKYIPGYSDMILTGLSIDDCASTCLNRMSFVCNSFWYDFTTGYCVLSRLHPDERPNLVVNNAFTDMYSKKYTVDYEMVPGTTVLSSSDVFYQNVYSADMCAKLCSAYDEFSCKSFDYCDEISTCYLGRTHFYDVPKADKVHSPICSHFSRQYLSDFRITTRQHLTNADDRIISGVSIGQCAKLCVEEERNDCASFGYCANKTECRLSTASMRNIGQVSSEPSFWCDVYNRQIFPDGTPYTPKSSKCVSPPPSTASVTSAHSTPNAEPSTSKSMPSSSSSKSMPASSSSKSMAASSSSKTMTSSSSSKSMTASSSSKSMAQSSFSSSTMEGTTNGQIISSQSPYTKKPLKNANSPPSSKKGLSAGGVVGVAIGMLVVGIVITALAYIGIKKFKRRLPGEMRVAYAKREVDIN
ncbi:uncharacterized protein LOC123525365 isoform X4 [Mercenaria mercenaria]|uniref:uncharacterized protein LOC123525365 isoform X3 n=1 Tax=Mercenaria mercenaria TaxID=6596 RepID=UPI00234F9506|nr:uncharacterized protein LOC123525365 isoform X3 [Mercenaria mercenaria]XP_045160292.2 uncharacterized protein LOC123525365 isoform X4 [Mercenaria mercenaria]